MENPATWNEATKLIAKVIDDYQRNVELVGLSLPRLIYDALKQEGFCLIQDKGLWRELDP